MPKLDTCSTWVLQCRVLLNAPPSSLPPCLMHARFRFPRTVWVMEQSTPKRKPLFDNPILTLAMVTIALSAASAYITFQIIGSRSSDPCATALGRARVEMSQSEVPSVFDEVKWEGLTDQYNEIFAVCDSATATKFATEEFNPWAAPALEVLRPPAGSPANAVVPAPSGSPQTPTTQVPQTPDSTLSVPVSSPENQ